MRNIPITGQNIRTRSEALAFLAECTLATVQDLISKTKPPQGETRRQMSIAQTAIDWAKPDYEGGCGRMDEVLKAGSIEAWVEARHPGALKPLKVSR